MSDRTLALALDEDAGDHRNRAGTTTEALVDTVLDAPAIFRRYGLLSAVRVPPSKTVGTTLWTRQLSEIDSDRCGNSVVAVLHHDRERPIPSCLDMDGVIPGGEGFRSSPGVVILIGHEVHRVDDQNRPGLGTDLTNLSGICHALFLR